jgi:hypothetical protein
MPFYVLYSASLSQTGSGPITASLDAKGNAITGSWTRLSAGTYQFASSGNLAPLLFSGSITGSLGLQYSYIPSNASDTGSNYILYNTSSNALILKTYSIASKSLADNRIPGIFMLKVGIVSGSI